MRVNVKLLGKALVIALSAFAVATSAYATAIPETQTFNTPNTATLGDDQDAGGKSTTATLGTNSFSQFDPSGGVLTGVTIGVTSTRTQTISGKGTGGGGSRTTTGTGSSTVTFDVPGASAIAAASTSGTCTDTGTCSYGPAVTTNPFNFTYNIISVISLNNYVGLGTFDATREASLSATSSGTFNNHSTTYTLSWTGSITTSYDYLYHATPSFDGASEVVTKWLDFGTQALSSGPVDLGFDVYNLLGIGDDGTVGLDLDSFSCAGDGCARFSTNLATFANPLAAGSSYPFTASFDTSVLGPFSATYTLNLSDADVGAPDSRNNNYQLTLNLQGEVRQVAEPVPLPGTLSLLATGVGLLGAALRRRST